MKLEGRLVYSFAWWFVDEVLTSFWINCCWV